MTSRLPSRHLLIVLLVAILGLSGCGQERVELGSNQIGLRLPDGYLIKAEVADTVAEREQGLSGRTSLAADAGMWFVFDHEDYYPFWMPNMNFAIDIIWVGSDFNIVEIADNVSPEPGVVRPQLKQYVNQYLAQFVLEVPAGTAAAHKLGAGDGLELISS